MVRERRGTCSECGKNSAVTVQGMVRMHLEPGNIRTRGNCPGSGWPPAAEQEQDRLPSVGLSREVVKLARAYNDLHRQLCPKWSGCPDHLKASDLLDEIWRQKRASAPQAAGVKCPCWYPELDPYDKTETQCNCGHAMDEHNDDGDCTVMEEEGG